MRVVGGQPPLICHADVQGAMHNGDVPEEVQQATDSQATRGPAPKRFRPGAGFMSAFTATSRAADAGQAGGRVPV
eukprot:7232610-Karenia_brevis.AAC.1